MKTLLKKIFEPNMDPTFKGLMREFAPFVVIGALVLGALWAAV